MITTSLYDGLVYFDCYPDISLALDDPNIVKVLTLNVLTFGYDMDEATSLLPSFIIFIIDFWVLNLILMPG